MMLRLGMSAASLILLTSTSAVLAQRPPMNQPDMTIDGPAQLSCAGRRAQSTSRGIRFSRDCREDGREHQSACQGQGL